MSFSPRSAFYFIETSFIQKVKSNITCDNNKYGDFKFNEFNQVEDSESYMNISYD